MLGGDGEHGDDDPHWDVPGVAFGGVDGGVAGCADLGDEAVRDLGGPAGKPPDDLRRERRQEQPADSACDGGSAVIGGASRSFTGPPGFGPITATLTEEKCSESDPTAATSP